jgi:ATP-dependent Clp protease ATP-binding subunit ClpX
VDKIIAQRGRGTTIGFGADVQNLDERGIGDLFQELEPEDLLKYGLIPEFVGRLPVIATLEDLDEDALVTILTEPKNALTKQYKKLFEMEDKELTFTDDALTAIAKRAIERKTGARGLRSILENLLLETMFDLPDLDGIGEIVVEEQTITEGKEPKQVKKKKSKAKPKEDKEEAAV